VLDLGSTCKKTLQHYQTHLVTWPTHWVKCKKYP